MSRLRAVPTYVWTFVALVVGVFSGGLLPNILRPVATGTALFIRVVIMLVPLLIFVALSPAVATLVRRGLAGRFATSVILWYVITSTVAGLLGLVVSSVLFNIPLQVAGGDGAWSEALNMIRAFGEQSSASLPLIAILASVVLGVVAPWIEPLYRFLGKFERAIGAIGDKMGYIMAPLVFFFGITLGVRFGAQLGMSHYITMTLYTAALCLVWFLFYVIVVIKYMARRPLRKVLTDYYVPTALFAAGTCSSLATLPVNLVNVKRIGVRSEVADFVVPFGAVANMNASALMYVAYAPFVMSYVFGMDISWVTLLIATPALVLFTIAAPGLPVGMGTALWTATLFASMMGLEEPLRSNFVVTWLALSGGLPDMFRTATNCTGDGFSAILFDRFFDRFASRGTTCADTAISPTTSQPPAAHRKETQSSAALSRIISIDHPGGQGTWCEPP